MSAASDVAIGVDLGGTKIEVAVLRRPNHDVLLRRRVATPSADGYDAILAAVASAIRDGAKDGGLDVATAPIGVGMPGSVTRASLVKNSNTVCLNGRPFRAELERALGRAIAFDNDANCFTLAEATLGAATPHRDGVVFGVILGTGVGGGVVAFGRVWSGLHGIAGEWGHHAVFCDRSTDPRSRSVVDKSTDPRSRSVADKSTDPRSRSVVDKSTDPRSRSVETQGPLCYCGHRGCLETFASGPAVEKDYETRSGVRLHLAEIALRRATDPHAAAAIDGLLAAFGRAVANVIDILDPSAIVLGGGVSNLELLYTEGRARVARDVFNDELLTPIVQNQLGDSAGVIGAALLARGP